jgi:hypothetical protein
LLLPGEYGGGTVIDTRDPDPVNHYLYISTSGSPAEVVKVAPGAGNALPSRVSAVTMQPGENFLRRGAADLGNGYAYFATLSVSGTVYPTVVKIGLTAGSAPPARIGAVQLDGATPYSIGSAVLDVGNGYGYFGTYDVSLVPAKVFKVSLGAGAAAPTLIGSVTLSAGPPAERELSTAVIDPASGYAFFGTDHTYGAKIFKIRLGAGNALPTEAGLVQLQSGTQPNPPDGQNVINIPETLYGEVFLQSSMIDPVSGYAYWGTDSHRGQVVKTAISEKGALKGTRVVLNETPRRSAPDSQPRSSSLPEPIGSRGRWIRPPTCRAIRSEDQATASFSSKPTVPSREHSEPSRALQSNGASISITTPQRLRPGLRFTH